MAVKLLYRANNAVKTLTCLESGIEIPKPYIRVNTSGYLPLTTQTSTGIKVQINGQEYSPIQSTITTAVTTVTQNYTYYEGILGSSQTSSYSQIVSWNSFRAYGGNLRSYQCASKYSLWNQEYSIHSGGLDISATRNSVNLTLFGFYTSYTYSQDRQSAIFYTSQGWIDGGSCMNSTITVINSNIKRNCRGFEEGAPPIMYKYHSYITTPLLLINYSYVTANGGAATKTFATSVSSANTLYNWAEEFNNIGAFNNHTYLDIRRENPGIYISSLWSNRSARVSVSSQNYSVSLSYMLNYMTTTDYGRTNHYNWRYWEVRTQAFDSDENNWIYIGRTFTGKSLSANETCPTPCKGNFAWGKCTYSYPSDKKTQTAEGLGIQNVELLDWWYGGTFTTTIEDEIDWVNKGNKSSSSYYSNGIVMTIPAFYNITRSGSWDNTQSCVLQYSGGDKCSVTFYEMRGTYSRASFTGNVKSITSFANATNVVSKVFTTSFFNYDDSTGNTQTYSNSSKCSQVPNYIQTKTIQMVDTYTAITTQQRNIYV